MEVERGQEMKKKKIRKVTSEEKLPFTEHLEELRWRLIIIIATKQSQYIDCFAFGSQ